MNLDKLLVLKQTKSWWQSLAELNTGLQLTGMRDCYGNRGRQEGTRQDEEGTSWAGIQGGSLVIVTQDQRIDISALSFSSNFTDSSDYCGFGVLPRTPLQLSHYPLRLTAWHKNSCHSSIQFSTPALPCFCSRPKTTPSPQWCYPENNCKKALVAREREKSKTKLACLPHGES